MDYNKICQAFGLTGELTDAGPYGFGHINSTYCLTVDGVRYIVQRINNSIFKELKTLA